MLVSLCVVFVSAAAAFAVSAMSGGGAGLVLLPVLRMVLPATAVPAALSLGTAISSMSRIALFFGHVQWRIVRGFVPAALPSAWLGACVLSRVDPVYLEVVLGVFLLGNLPMLFRRGVPPARVSLSSWWTLPLIGALAGFVSGLTGAVGLLFNGFYLRQGLTAQQVVATRAANDILLHVAKLGIYAGFGLLDRWGVIVGLMVGGAAVTGTWMVRRLLVHVSGLWFRRMGYGAMVAAGVSMTLSAGDAIVTRHATSISGPKADVSQGRDHPALTRGARP
ncbi:hypothetical protein FHW69_001987 [Luteibacter sp. Sphag1AF]|uniref:sulfite exporter TauE/SafE family protein n=1 Tax=Luteibacter sp. Sphag1AF TaxID=2587031 RepID=UPI00161170B4|nr:sulfite exporter TauE/SafE family protein [Luteibacter sp. Sphag1AF]MBB3227364.1 hypothetical protein [Luteibacter sp. Sphag1AF]